MSTEPNRSLSDLRALLDEPQWPSREKYFVDLVLRMHAILDRTGISQRELARRTGWKESFVSRLLGGDQNPTILTLAKFEDAVGEDLLTVTTDPVQRRQPESRSTTVVNLDWHQVDRSLEAVCIHVFSALPRTKSIDVRRNPMPETRKDVNTAILVG